MSSLSESSTMKQPIKRLEIQINNFNIAVPHHVDLLKRHKNNILKVSISKEFGNFLYIILCNVFVFIVPSATRLGENA